MPNPSQYLHVKAWGIMLSSDPSYIALQQENAARTNAPLDAIFQRSESNRWHCFHEVTREDSRRQVLAILERLRRG